MLAKLFLTKQRDFSVNFEGPFLEYPFDIEEVAFLLSFLSCFFTDCGVRPIREARIVGGRETQFGDWPWQVLVKESTILGLFTKNKCGGVLISDRHVLTAAHCQPGKLVPFQGGEHSILIHFLIAKVFWPLCRLNLVNTTSLAILNSWQP